MHSRCWNCWSKVTLAISVSCNDLWLRAILRDNLTNYFIFPAQNGGEVIGGRAILGLSHPNSLLSYRRNSRKRRSFATLDNFGPISVGNHELLYPGTQCLKTCRSAHQSDLHPCVEVQRVKTPRKCCLTYKCWNKSVVQIDMSSPFSLQRT